jgi:hypothetical protein
MKQLLRKLYYENFYYIEKQFQYFGEQGETGFCNVTSYGRFIYVFAVTISLISCIF